MTNKRIIELWLNGHSKEWLMDQQAIDIKFEDRGRGKKATFIKSMARHDVEQALLEWWRRQTKDEKN